MYFISTLDFPSKLTFFLDKPDFKRLEEAKNMMLAVSSMSGSDDGEFDIHSDIFDIASPDLAWIK